MDKINLMKILSEKVGKLLSLSKAPTHYFNDLGDPLLSIDEIIAQSTKGPIFC